MRLTPKDIAEKKNRLARKVNKGTKTEPRVSPSRKSRRHLCVPKPDSDDSSPCCLWEEVSHAIGHDSFLSVKMSGQTTKYTQKPQDIEWFCDVAPRVAAVSLIKRFDADPQDFVFFSEGDKTKDSKIQDCAASGVAATIDQTMRIVQSHMNDMREHLRTQFHCLVWGASNDKLSKFEAIFGKDRVLGASERKFGTPSHIAKVWPGIENCRAIKYAGSHFEATWAADLTFRIEGDRALTDTARSFYGPRRVGQDYFIRPTQTALSKALRNILDRGLSCA